MIYDQGSAISFTPDHSGVYRVMFTCAGDSWYEPIIGWALIANDLPDEDDPEKMVRETRVQPVVLDSADGYPATMPNYGDSRRGLDGPYIQWRVVRA